MNSAGGRCHDNARCESMWARMKTELLYDRYDTRQMTVEELKVLIWRYFLSYWNNRRIKYFCQPCAPTKSNGQRTRNRPFHAPDKWEAFKKYNLRDVEAEMGIQQRLAKFPVPQKVWEEYHQSEEINDTGVRLDMELVAQAIEMDTLSRQKLTASIKRMSLCSSCHAKIHAKRGDR